LKQKELNNNDSGVAIDSEEARLRREALDLLELQMKEKMSSTTATSSISTNESSTSAPSSSTTVDVNSTPSLASIAPSIVTPLTALAAGRAVLQAREEVDEERKRRLELEEEYAQEKEQFFKQVIGS